MRLSLTRLLRKTEANYCFMKKSEDSVSKIETNLLYSVSPS